MRFRPKIYLLLILLGAIFSALFYYLESINLNRLKHFHIQEIQAHRLSEIRYIIEDRKKLLFSLAEFLATNPNVLKAYLNNDRKALIDFAQPLWNSFKKNRLLYELHFFKRPAISYVNFFNLKEQGLDVASIRHDILTINRSFQPSAHFYVCKTFPGLRVTYPIIYNDRLLGSVSVGINIETFKEYLLALDAKEVEVILNKELLQKHLDKNIYKKYIKEAKLYKKDFLVIPATEPYPLQEKNSNKLYTKYKIYDFDHNLFGYIVTVDDLSTFKNRLQAHSLFSMLDVLGFAFLFLLAIFLVLRTIFGRIDAIAAISEYIRKKHFEKIPETPIKKPSSKIDEIYNALLDSAKELDRHIKFLTNEVEDFKNKSYIDPLTNTFNRRFLKEYGPILFEKYRLSNSPFSVLMIDIDDFKQINDTLGHDFGDFVLEEVATIIKNILRENDIVIRYGGEEFLVLLPNTSLKNGFKIAQKILQEITKHPFVLGDHKISVTVSIGVSEPHIDDTSIEDAIKRADIKLYNAKKKGKKRVEI